MTTQYLSTFLNYEKDLSKFFSRDIHLKRVRRVLLKLGSPENSLKVIHVAGSKGKGSTSAFVAHILREAGYKVGLYTSPHLYNLRERFRVLDNKIRRKNVRENEIFDDCISPKEFRSLLKKICPVLEECRHHRVFGDLTYFEVLTIAAFCYFQDQKVDFAVLETGLGGRLDATNVCQSLIAAITSISLEHTHQLGKTLKKIAGEKSGIIKRNCALITAPQCPEVLKVIKARCRALGVLPIIAGTNAFKIPLLGEHQNVNAAVAVGVIKALRRLGFSVSQQAVKKGLANAFWPLRFEVLRRKPDIVLDGAHNPASAKHLVATLRKNFPVNKVVLVFGSSDDKDILAMARHLFPIAQTIILTQAAHARAFVWSDEYVKENFPEHNVSIISSTRQACQLALKIAGANGLILVAGSLFVAAEARKIFSKII